MTFENIKYLYIKKLSSAEIFDLRKLLMYLCKAWNGYNKEHLLIVAGKKAFVINVNERRNKGKIMLGYGSKYLSVYFKIRVCLEIYGLRMVYTSPTQNIQKNS